MIRNSKTIAAMISLGAMACVALWVGARSAAAQNTPPAKAAVEQLLKDFAAAIAANDLAAAQKLFATEDDFKGLFTPEAAKQSAANIQSRLKLAFPEFVAALKEFGKHDLYEANPGNSLVIPPGQRGNTGQLRIYESGYLSFAKDTNFLVELRLRVGGIVYGANNRWVFTNMTNRQEFFSGKGGT